jgi:hypothetical protein
LNLISSFGQSINESMEYYFPINIDGFAGYKYILSDDRTDDENDYFLNHPTSATSTILFEKNTFRNIFKTKYNCHNSSITHKKVP